MLNIKTIFLFTGLLLFSAIAFSQKKLHLYGGENRDVYLGCMNCSEIDSKSIWNDIGTYGSDISSKSIWNDIGTYGSDISSYSPWNDIASNPPAIMDEDGGFYGYFTTNTIKSNRTEIKLFVYILDNNKTIRKNRSEFKKRLPF